MANTEEKIGSFGILQKEKTTKGINLDNSDNEYGSSTIKWTRGL